MRGAESRVADTYRGAREAEQIDVAKVIAGGEQSARIVTVTVIDVRSVHRRTENALHRPAKDTGLSGPTHVFEAGDGRDLSGFCGVFLVHRVEQQLIGTTHGLSTHHTQKRGQNHKADQHNTTQTDLNVFRVSAPIQVGDGGVVCFERGVERIAFGHIQHRNDHAVSAHRQETAVRAV